MKHCPKKRAYHGCVFLAVAHEMSAKWNQICGHDVEVCVLDMHKVFHSVDPLYITNPGTLHVLHADLCFGIKRCTMQIMAGSHRLHVLHWPQRQFWIVFLCSPFWSSCHSEKSYWFVSLICMTKNFQCRSNVSCACNFRVLGSWISRCKLR